MILDPAYVPAVSDGGQMSFMNVGTLVKFSISGVGDKPKTLECGNQGNGTLTLIPAQKGKWDGSWSKDAAD